MAAERPADAAVREQALGAERSFIVQAPAGSGKTTLLTQRFLCLLSRVDNPEAIIALTFTRKAAEEMRGRILAALRLARQSPDELDPVSRRWALAALEVSDARDWRLLDSPRRLRVQTIDSLSAAIARRAPLLSGYAGNAAVLEDATQLYQSAARAAINQIAGQAVWAEPMRAVLRHLDNDWNQLEGHLIDMLSRRDQWLRFVVRHPDREAFEGALEAAVVEDIRRVAGLLPRDTESELVALCAYVGANILSDYPDNRGGVLADVGDLPGVNADDLPVWQAIADLFLTKDGNLRRRLSKKEGFSPGSDGLDAAKARFQGLAARLGDVPGLFDALHDLRASPWPRYSDEQWHSLEALFTVLKLAAAELKVAFAAAAAVDFVEVTHAALAALGDGQTPSELGLLLDYEIQHLLIDEFQDTSITQFELIGRLIDGWSQGDGRTVFLVGDPMQSIYRFRQAEVSLFIDTYASCRIGSVPLTPLQLTTNFRTQATVIDWINNALTHAQDGTANPFAGVPQLVAAREATAVPGVCSYGTVDDDGDAEARIVVDIVRRTLSRHPDFSIGILVRGRRHLGSINAALAAAGVSVSASDIYRLDEQTVVQDLVALTRPLLHPADRIAWLGVLRAPWCGVTLSTLSVLFENDDEGTIWQRLGDAFEDDGIEADERERLRGFYNVLAPALAAVGREAISRTVENTWIALAGPRLYPQSQLHHAERFFERLSECEHRETLVTATRLADLLQRQYVSPSPQSHSKVEIMTIHRAKGLEFDVVIVPGFSRAPRSEQRRLLAWKQTVFADASSLLFAPIPRRGANGDDINDYLHRAEKRELENEGHRLLYVALTRARETLHLIANFKRPKNEEPFIPAARSFSRMLWNVLEEEIPIDDEPAVVVRAAETEKRQILRRPDRADWNNAGPERGPLSLPRATMPREDIEFSWAGSLAKHVGTVTHELLQRICAEGLSHWEARSLSDLTPYISGRLRGIGVNATELQEAAERVVAALRGVLGSERGRWILDERHVEAANEYALTAIVDGVSASYVIDRTFIDDTGVRWIIDYKTGSHVGGGIDEFIESEFERYRPQLERYAELISARESRPIALGLFFPLLDRWREWRYFSPVH